MLYSRLQKLLLPEESPMRKIALALIATLSMVTVAEAASVQPVW